MISVIVPVYNAEKYLHRCVNSILMQKYTDFEILLINDGSTDSSGSICDYMLSMDKRIRVFHKENGGVSSARNLGLENAKGEWITFCDSDDYVDDYWLENFIDANLDNKFDLVVESVKMVSYNTELVAGPKYVIEGDAKKIMIALKYHGGTIGYSYNKLFRSSIIKVNNIRYREDIRLREDEEFVLRFLKYCDLCKVIDKGGYVYFVPDYHGKYVDIDIFWTLIDMYKTAKIISEGKNNSALDCYRKELTLHFIAMCKEKKFSYIKPYFRTIGITFFRANNIKNIFSKFFMYIKKFVVRCVI